MIGSVNDSTILKLRVKGSDLDPLALRGRLQNLFDEVSMQPRLPASATLFIRKLKDPLPGALDLDSAYPRAPQAWKHAFNTRFDQLVASAARPAFGLVADSAESVVFYDYAELLASLSADWCSGNVQLRWWWQSFLKRGNVSHVVKQFWRDKIEYGPAALQLLAKRSVVTEFVTLLHDDEARDLVRRMVQVFGLHSLRSLVHESGTSPSLLTPKQGAESSSDQRPAQELLVRIAAPWRYVVPESESPRLSAPQQLLVGLGLMLQRAPVRVRSLSFAQEVQEWQEHILSSNALTIAVDGRKEPPASPVEISSSELIAADEAVSSPANTPALPDEAPLAATQPKSLGEQVKIGNVVFTHEAMVHDSEAAVQEPSQKADTPEDLPLVESAAGSEAEPEIFADVSEVLDSITIETNLGGLFYLINLGIFLEIYTDFTNPVERFTELSIWDFVAQLGTNLLGEFDEEDPVWTLLASLVEPNREPSDKQWLTDLLPSIRTRLRQALGVNSEADLSDLLLRHYARVTITTTHLDVFFSIAQHPIEIRLSGLDRNPGWVPAAGRFIAFHYD